MQFRVDGSDGEQPSATWHHETTSLPRTKDGKIRHSNQQEKDSNATRIRVLPNLQVQTVR
jgi:hypothetical protein